MPRGGTLLTQDPIGLAGGVNLYAYAGNNPIRYIDPFGLDTIQLQIVRIPATTKYHTSIRIAPDNGHKAFTLGAGPASLTRALAGAPTTLVSERDRSGDVGAQTASIDLNLGGQAEAQVIKKLAAQDAAYQDDLAYELEPKTGDPKFNSNSYTAAMLRAAGIVIPAFKYDVPGFDNPIPAESLK
jgi:uncharacterized protein RhaS with RHS repeats